MITITRRQLFGMLAVALMLGCSTSTGSSQRLEPVSGAEANSARNVILFLGDGMGISTITAARILAGQLEDKPGEAHRLSFDDFPHVALVTTYNTDSQVSDSAGTMTAIMSGVKTRAGVIGIGPKAVRGQCETLAGAAVPSLLQQLEDRGYRTGIVSTARITHATPAATYAHSVERNWEADVALPEGAQNCPDIARQLVEFDHGDGIDVILGGGRGPFLPVTFADPEEAGQTGIRADGRNLVSEWQTGAEGRQYVWNQEGFDQLNDQGQVLGLFESSHMEFEADRAGDTGGEPSLAEMTEFAISALDRPADTEEGFFLMVEAGRIDHGHHAGNAYRALHDTIALDAAVRAALAATDPQETLIVVTADHSHTLTISGYPARGNPIFGYVADSHGEAMLDREGHPYTTLGYMNGPGARPDPDPPGTDPEDTEYLQRAAVRLVPETHGGEDVGAFAYGAGAEGVRGVMDQNELYDVMAKAVGLQ